MLSLTKTLKPDAIIYIISHISQDGIKIRAKCGLRVERNCLSLS